jgi:hypothetical protein
MLPAIFGPFSIAKNNEVQIYRILSFSERWRSLADATSPHQNQPRLRGDKPSGTRGAFAQRCGCNIAFFPLET